ncbi:hypothetical protein Nepgr_011886 [Nepenthes gracilis]|uniref:DUF599 domain-containing protein n=1 Tax=Nepenthes gracilis TaxID=150966 RepID=A0AAD3SFW9_NEPGR|nr:hypothetical protein Nepgr_011886 [Nepenthes gracilis]
MGVVFNSLDTILIPLSLFITLGYHVYLWHNFKNHPSLTTVGLNIIKRREWLLGMREGDDKGEMLAVQSLRNNLMAAILTASITVIITISLAALANNTYNADDGGSRLFSSPFFGAHSGPVIAIKYAAASVFLLISFLSSSIAVGFLIDANFLINASGEFRSRAHAKEILERGLLLSVVGNRVLCVAFPLMLWMLGPVPAAVSAAALVCGLYEYDFAGSFGRKK